MHLQVLTLLFFCVAQIQLTKQQRRFSVVFRSFHEEQLSQVEDMKTSVASWGIWKTTPEV